MTPALAKLLLHTLEWSLPEIINLYEQDAHGTLVAAKVKPANNNNTPKSLIPCSVKVGTTICPVCIANQPTDSFKSLACGHPFCKECWSTHFEVQIVEGISTGNTFIFM